MAEVIKTIVDVEINTGQAAAQLQALQQQINAFNLAINKNNAFQTNATKKYTTELKDVVNSSKFFTAETVRMKTAAGALDSTLKRGSATLGQFFQARFNKNSALFAETLGLASERARVMQTQFVATAGASKGMQEALAIRPIAAFNSQMSISAQRAQILTNMFKQGTTQLINFGKNVQWAGRQLMVGFTVPLTIFGVTAGKIFRDLEKEVVNFRKVYGDIFTTDVQVEEALSDVKELASEFTKYGVAVKDTLELAAIGAQAGKTGNELLAATTQATRLSVLGDLDKNQAMRTSIALQSAFRLSNDELANSINFLNMVENSSVLSLQDLAEAIPRVAPIIVGLGGDVKDMAVFLTAMREGGVSAAEAANGLKSSLGRLISPTKQAKDMANSFGISLEKIVEVNEGDVLQMVISLSNSMQQLTDLQKQQLLSAVFGKFQFARMGALFENITREGSNAQNVIKMMDTSIEDMAKTADKELSAIEESAGTKIVAAMERLKLSVAPIGELFVQLAIPVINFFTSLIEKFNNLPDFQKRFIAMASVIVGLVIPAGTMFIGLLMNLSGTLAKIMQGIGLFVKGMVTQGGIVGAIKAVTQSTKYMSLEEIDAALAAQQLGKATVNVNSALRNQVNASVNARAAIMDLANTYSVLIQRMSQAATLAPVTLGASGAAMRGASRQIKGASPQKFARGGKVPGTGNTDTVPAMLMPGEFVVKKSSVNKIGTSFLEKLNNGGIARLEDGGDAFSRLKAMKAEQAGASTTTSRPTAASAPLPGFAGISEKNLESGFHTRVFNAYAKHSPSNLQLLGSNTMLLPEGINQAMRTTGGGLNPAQRKQLAQYLRSAGSDALSPVMEASKASGVIISKKEAKSLVNSIASRVESGSTTRMYDRDFTKLVNAEIGKRSKLIPVLKELRTAKSAFRVSGSTQDIIDVLNMESPGRYELSKDPVFDSKGKLDKRGRIFDKKQNQSFVYGSKDTKDLKQEVQKQAFGTASKSKSYQQLGKSKMVKAAMAAISARTGQKRLQLSHFNQGGMVPSLLTPGEFLVNREAASANQTFLQALNSGKVQKFQDGGDVQARANLAREVEAMKAKDPTLTTQKAVKIISAPQRRAAMATRVTTGISGAAGAAAFPALIAGPMMQQSSNEVTKKFGDIVTASVPVLFGMQILAPALKALALKLPLLMNPVGAVIVGVLALGTIAAIAAKQIKDVQESGARLSSAMTGSADKIQGFADDFGRKTIGEERIISAAQARSGETSAESQSMAQQFMETDSGKQLLQDMELVKRSGQDTITALRNQLNQLILAGLLSADEAKSIAAEVGAALGDANLAVKASAQIIDIVGPEGELLVGNVLKIQAQLQTSLDPETLKQSAEAAYEENATSFMKLRDKIFGGENGAREVAIRDIEIAQTQKEVTNNLTATSNAMEQLKKGYQDGTVDIKTFREETENLRKTAGETVTKGLDALGVSLEDLQKKSGSKSLFDLKGTEQWLTKTEKGAVKMLTELKENAGSIFKGAALGKDVTQDLLRVITEDLAGGDAEEAAQIFAQVISGDIDKSVLNQLLAAIEDPDLKEKLRALFNVQINVTGTGVPGAIFDPDAFKPEDDPELPKGSKQKSKIEQIRESAKATKDYANAVKQLANEKNKEAVASIGTGFAELKGNAQRKEAIKLIQQQLNLQKLVDFAMQGKKEQEIARLNMATRVIDLEATSIQRQIEGVKRLNELDQRRINQIQRLNEMDQRQMDLRNRALDQISKKEKDVNKLYDEKTTALDRVATANDRIANQEKGRLDLASALTSGDIAAAAAAANAMTQGFAQTQIEDARSQLELQRQREIDALTGSINGQLFTRQEIELQLDDLNERIYQRNLNIRDIQDQIYQRELSIIPLEDQIYQLGLKREAILDQINIKQLEIEQAEYRKMLQTDATNKVLGKQRQIVKDIVSDLNAAIRLSEFLAGQRAKGAFGGNVSSKKIGMAMGGKVNYKGSSESPPALMMGGGAVKKYAVGNVVPGLGNTDRVPALLTPGEFVVRKSVAKQNMGFLKALNSDIFPKMGNKGFGESSNLMQETSNAINNMPVYNSYSVNVNVPNTNASPEEIANVVMSRIQRSSMSTIRTTRR